MKIVYLQNKRAMVCLRSTSVVPTKNSLMPPSDHRDPTIAEPVAICWALELVAAEGFLKIIVESDAKICIDALSCNSNDCPWKIRALTTLSLELAIYFSICNFSWVKREANQSAHVLAKVPTSSCLPFCCFKDALPPSVKEVWLRDVLSCAS